MKAKAAILALMLSFPLSVQAEPSSTPNNYLRSILSYDRHWPLQARSLEKVRVEGHLREKIVINGFDGEPIHLFLSLPRNARKAPVVIALHGITESKTQWWKREGEYSFPSAHRRQLLRAGYAVLALDARAHGDRILAHDFSDQSIYLQRGYFQGLRDIILDSSKDVRRALDWVATRPDLDADRIALFGFSMGANIGFISSAIDERIDASVLMAAVPIPPQQEDGLTQLASPFLFAPQLGHRPVLMIMAEEDSFYTPEAARALYGTIGGENKSLVMVGGGHDLPRSTARTAVQWLETNLPNR